MIAILEFGRQPHKGLSGLSLCEHGFFEIGTQRTLPTLDTPAADISSGRC
jgi:hypothetical protein